MRTLIAVFLAVSVGCTQQGSSDMSGQRLKVRRLNSDDGATVPIGFYDAQLTVNCSFAEGASGYRCLPAMATVHDYFGDPSCSMRLADAPASSPKVKFARERDGSKLYQVTEISTSTLYALSAGTCTSIPLPGATAFYTLGAEFGLEKFAAATAVTDP